MTKCIAVIMADGNNHSFEMDDVVEILPDGTDCGSNIYGNPKFKIVKLDMDITEAISLLEPEYDIFMNAIKGRAKQLRILEISGGTEKDQIQEISRDVVIDKTIIKPIDLGELPKKVIVG